MDGFLKNLQTYVHNDDMAWFLWLHQDLAEAKKK